MFFSIVRVVSVVSLVGSAVAATYSRSDHVVGSGFNSFFSYQAIPDPTNGRVNYVNEQTAQSKNLTFASSNTFILRADDTTTLSASGPGRNSVRLMSNKQYTSGVMVFNIRHMPQGCGTWPAVWTVGANWPDGGEIDILEGVNDQTPNQATLHTSAGCTMPASRSETGTPQQNNCDVDVNSNAGCGVKLSDNRSYGPSFNSNGGGWYAMELTSSGIKVWFWTRNGGGVPSDVSSGSSSINTSNWVGGSNVFFTLQLWHKGTPAAFFPNTDCDISSFFGPQNIIINLTFCGDWAGQSTVYASSGCPSTCVDYVNNNPSAFTNAYFDFASLDVFQ